MDSKNIHVIKVGGSILSLSDDELFSFSKANEFKASIEPLFTNNKFILVTGGGYICRKYQKLLRENGYSDFDQHYVGTCACNLNAIMLRSVFGDLAEKDVITFNDFDKEGALQIEKNVLLGGAAKPGPSSDEDAVRLAVKSNAKQILSLKDIDGVYSADPKKDPNAKRLDFISWDEYLNIIGNPNAHTPGGNLPVDPIAAREAKEHGIKFIIISGNDFENMKKAINGEEFIGTIIN